jgi:hypothetical protein
MAKKTFKIGEYCAGGVISVEITGKKVAVIQRNWDFSKGAKRGSSQANAPELDRITVNADESGSFRAVDDFLHNITTSYYAGQVLDYIESNVRLKQVTW